MSNTEQSRENFYINFINTMLFNFKYISKYSSILEIWFELAIKLFGINTKNCILSLNLKLS